MTFREKLPRAVDWLRSDEWIYFVFPDIALVVILFAFLVTIR